MWPGRCVARVPGRTCSKPPHPAPTRPRPPKRSLKNRVQPLTRGGSGNSGTSPAYGLCRGFLRTHPVAQSLPARSDRTRRKGNSHGWRATGQSLVSQKVPVHGEHHAHFLLRCSGLVGSRNWSPHHPCRNSWLVCGDGRRHPVWGSLAPSFVATDWFGCACTTSRSRDNFSVHREWSDCCGRRVPGLHCRDTGCAVDSTDSTTIRSLRRVPLVRLRSPRPAM